MNHYTQTDANKDRTTIRKSCEINSPTWNASERLYQALLLAHQEMARLRCEIAELETSSEQWSSVASRLETELGQLERQLL